MSKLGKFSAIVFLIALVAAMLACAVASAQDEITDQFPQVPNPNVTPTPPATAETAIVVVAASVGGTTTPATGTYTYNYGDTINLQATPNSGYKFAYWTISGSFTPGHNVPPINYPEQAINDPEFVPTFPSPSQAAENSLVTSTNPLNVICGYGYTFVYQPVFAPSNVTVTPTTNNPPPANSSVAIVNVINGVGGTTNPGPGTYTYENGKTISLQATADSGNSFAYWVVTGQDGHPVTVTDNPTNIDCGYGYTYSYQPMFAATDTSSTNDQGIPNTYLYVIIVVLVIIAIAGFVLAATRGRRRP
jgi:hypothetical protein